MHQAVHQEDPLGARWFRFCSSLPYDFVLQRTGRVHKIFSQIIFTNDGEGIPYQVECFLNSVLLPRQW